MPLGLVVQIPLPLSYKMETFIIKYKFCNNYNSLFALFSLLGLHMTGAILALFSLFLMVMGALCVTMSLSKSVPFFLKPATICFVFSGTFQTPHNCIWWLWNTPAPFICCKTEVANYVVCYVLLRRPVSQCSRLGLATV